MIIFIASGGTGGHIMPAKSVANELSKENDVFILGDQNCLNYFKNNQNFRRCKITSSQIKKSPLEIIKFLTKVLLGFSKSLLLILAKKPKYVICFGGYATFPIALATIFSPAKLIIHEQNAHLGKVNRIFAKYANKIAISFPKTSGLDSKYLNKVFLTGNPIRQEIISLNDLEYKLPSKEVKKVKAKDRMGYRVILHSDFKNVQNVSREPFIISVIGGSGGAKIFSEILPKAFFNLSDALKENLFIFQQCRKDLVKSTFENYKLYNLSVTVNHFFEDMASLIADSHLVIARSGSSTIFELSAAKRPMILIPFAKSADDHQLKNAQFFAKHKAAEVIEEKDFTVNNLTRLLSELILNDKKLYELSSNSAKIADLAASKKICELITK